MHLVRRGDPTTFAQIWPSAATGEWVIRRGTLGRAGTISETGLDASSVHIGDVAGPLLGDGHTEAEYSHWVVVQFPTRSKSADLTLIRHATEWLEETLDARGLGIVDGFDRGKHSLTGKIVVNLYLLVVDAELGCQAAMAALRAGRADQQRATIAHREEDGEEWTVRYERTSGKFPGPFAI